LSNILGGVIEEKPTDSLGHVQGTDGFLGRNSATGLDYIVIDDRQGLDPKVIATCKESANE
jgi:hypothetical protein